MTGRPRRGGGAWRRRWRDWDERTGDRAWSLLWWLGVPLFAVFTMPYVIQDVGPSFEARFGDGRRGVFTAETEDCGGRGGCTYYGTFRSDDGSLVREDVLMATGGGVAGVGDTVPAIDTDDRAAVYPPDGGWDWLLVAAFAVAIPAVSVAWLLKPRVAAAASPVGAVPSGRRIPPKGIRPLLSLCEQVDRTVRLPIS